MSRLLARYADCLFWLARYMVRAENLARLLEIQESFARDSRGGNDWRVVLAINADGERFFASHPAADATSVLRFYVVDRTNPTSIISDLHLARENARALRPLISTEMWTQLNVFYNRVAALRPGDASEERVARLCAVIKEGCQTHLGITTGTFYRDEGWCFYRLGAAIETADQTTRLLDQKLLSFELRDDDPGSAADISYWTALLRSAAGYQAFRRKHPRGMTPETVAAFMLCDAAFPRSVACSLGTAATALTELRRLYGLRAASRALEAIDDLSDQVELRKVKAVIGRGHIHQFNDHIQSELGELTTILAESFFGYQSAVAA
jgi:uncharacterized alpha-E superfamily protein